MFHRVAHLLCVCLLSFFSLCGAAAAVEPLTDVLLDIGTADESAARGIAVSQAQTGSSPLYDSSTPNESVTYAGLFVPASDDTKLAVFSDDGCKVTIDGATVLDRFQVGQHLPNLQQSFHVLRDPSDPSEPFPFEAGRSYSVRIEYSNTVHPGDWDIDGLTVFAFAGEVAH